MSSGEIDDIGTLCICWLGLIICRVLVGVVFWGVLQRKDQCCDQGLFLCGNGPVYDRKADSAGAAEVRWGVNFIGQMI